MPEAAHALDRVDAVPGEAPAATSTQAAARCPACALELPAATLSCPSCQTLVHRDALKQLATAAGNATSAGDHAAALVAWRRALELLPPRSKQHAQITERVRALSRVVDTLETAPAAPSTPASAKPKTLGGKLAGAVAAVGLMVWKLKFVFAFLLGKGKLLLLGLTKLSTLTTMAVSLGVYWAAFGWVFALGLVLSIYVHEMGHVAALRRFGIAAGAPMFVPWLGALVRLKQYPVDAREDARVGLAGPIYGLGAAFAAFAVGSLGGWPSWLAIARAGAWINLFNLLPVWQLDGGRGFRALTRNQRLWAGAAIGTAWLLTHEVILGLLLIATLFRAFGRDAPAEGDRRTLVEYVGLVATLAALAAVHVPGLTGLLP